MITDMNESELWPHLTAVFRQVFDDDELTIGPGTTAKDIESWDSLSNIRLVVAVEKRFGVRFNIGEVAALQNVGQLLQLIKKRLGAADSTQTGKEIQV
jgi:acyl carrier protein